MHHQYCIHLWLELVGSEALAFYMNGSELDDRTINKCDHKDYYHESGVGKLFINRLHPIEWNVCLIIEKGLVIVLVTSK